MFKVIGNKEELEKPLIEFVNKVNEEYYNERDKLKEILKSRMDKVKIGGLADKINMPDIIVAIEERPDGFLINTIVGKNKFLNMIFGRAFKKGKKNLEGYLKEVGVKNFKVVKV